MTGRVMLSRIGGKLCFATIRDGTGDIQVMISQDRVGPEALASWKHDVDLGDHVGVEGEVISSRSGELSVLADSFAITSKSLRPLPEKHRGLSDVESRVRQRYVDLIVNPETRRMAELKSAVIRSIRDELHARGFLEVSNGPDGLRVTRPGLPPAADGLAGFEQQVLSEARTRLFNFVCIEPFHRLWMKHGLTEDDLIRLENEILAAPRKGDEIR